jgi:DNA phosphorothioation-associated putative methyltransferase
MGKGVDVGQTLVASDRSQAAIVQLCQQSKIGKCLPNAFYIHRSALPHLDEQLFQQEQSARGFLDAELPFTLIKFHFDQPKLSYLYYPDFDQEPHPLLRTSTVVDWQTGTVDTRDYSDAPNPPLLHRKETFVARDYPHYNTFAWLTKQEEVLGLLESSRGIGLRNAWEQRLRDRTLVIHDHSLACPIQTGAKPTQANVS